jgi:hypothetical protein
MAPKIARTNTIRLLELREYYQEKIADLRIQRHSTAEAITPMTEVVVVNTWREIEYRFDVCGANNDAHIETY